MDADGDCEGWVWVEHWAQGAGVARDVALMWARSGQLTGACRLPGGYHLVRFDATRQAPRQVIPAPWVRLPLSGPRGEALLEWARRRNFTAVAVGSFVFAPLSSAPALLSAWKETQRRQLHYAWVLAAEVELERRGWSRIALSRARERFPEREWSVLSLRYALGEEHLPRGVASTARRLNMRPSEVVALERTALRRTSPPPDRSGSVQSQGAVSLRRYSLSAGQGRGVIR